MLYIMWLSGLRRQWHPGIDRDDVPQPKKPHSATRRFCEECFADTFEQSNRDLEKLDVL